MKFLFFSDLHYAPHAFRTLEWEALRTFQEHAEKENCEMIIHAGDFCHRPNDSKEFIKAYNDFHIPSYHCLGNHDMDHATIEETVALYNMPNPYYFFERGGYRFIILNEGYIQEGDNYIPFSNGNYFSNLGASFIIPPFEVEWLKETIASSKVPCILISHVGFERLGGVKNLKEIRDIIDEANEKVPHSVLMCINGHYHRDRASVVNNVIYYDAPSVSHEWVGDRHNAFPKEECERYVSLAQTIVFADPLHSIITIEGTTVTVEGMKGSYYRGVDSKTIGYDSYDGNGVPLYPSVQSFKITV